MRGDRKSHDSIRRDGFPTVHRAGATPVPIPNTEVKPCFGDGTAHFLCGRVARRWDLFIAASEGKLLAPLLRLGLYISQNARHGCVGPAGVH